jgi:hypothetical protein
LALNGYLSVINRKSSKTTFWRCENYKTCPATATTSASNSSNVTLFKNHTHEPDFAKIEVAKRKLQMKEAVTNNPHKSIKRLYSEAFPASDRADIDLVAARPDFKNIRSAMYKCFFPHVK